MLNLMQVAVAIDPTTISLNMTISEFLQVSHLGKSDPDLIKILEMTHAMLQVLQTGLGRLGITEESLMARLNSDDYSPTIKHHS